MPATVRALFISPEKKAPPLSVTQVEAGRKGFDGDCHNGSANRQILILSAAVLEEFQLSTGMLFENVVVDEMDIMAFETGQKLRIGSAVLELTIPCEPCVQMDRIRPGLRKALQGRRGMFARVAAPGTIRLGDSVSVL